jgi:hypothetical protein
LHLPCASTPYSLDGLPGIFPTRRAHGACPSELYRTEIAHAFRRSFPSCDWLPDRCSRHKACLLASACAPPEIGSPTTRSSNEPLVIRPSRASWCLSAFGAEASLPQRLRFRGFLPLPVGAAVARFLRVRHPWLSWDSSSLGRSPSEPRPQRLRQALPVAGSSAQPRTLHSHRRDRPRVEPLCARSPLGTSGRSHLHGSAPCASECQRAGK